VNFYMFPPPSPQELTLEHLEYRARLNPPGGFGAANCSGGTVRVVLAGFDPVSIAPHGVRYRAYSAEGQLSHTTDILERLARVKGRFVPVRVPNGQAWESPAAFFAKPQILKTKDDEGYNTVRFVPERVLRELRFREGQVLQAEEFGRARVWNGDSFEGWRLRAPDGTCGRSWQEVSEALSELCARRLRESGQQLCTTVTRTLACCGGARSGEERVIEQL